MIKLTEHLHNAIRSGQAECFCPEWTKMERTVTHLPGCRWQMYIEEIYRLERIAAGIPVFPPDLKEVEQIGPDTDIRDYRGVYGTKDQRPLDGSPSRE